MIAKDFYFQRVDLREIQRVFEDDQDFIVYINLLQWNSGVKRVEEAF